MRSDTACSCDLSWYIFVMACRLRTSDLAITFTDSCSRVQGVLCVSILNEACILLMAFLMRTQRLYYSTHHPASTRAAVLA